MTGTRNLRGEAINHETLFDLLTAFTTVFFIFGLGFAVQRLRPLNDRTLAQLSVLVVEILLPFYLFFTTATGVTSGSLVTAPALIAMGILVPLLSYPLATLALKPAGVAAEQRQAFRFSALTANTAFLGFPVCQALFGPVGLVYAVLYDFGTTMVVFTFGVWALNGGRLKQWRPLVLNPLILGVLAGLAWAFSGWPFPAWLAPPFQALGDATLPLALLVGGAQIGNLNAAGRMWRQQLAGLSLVRLVAVPLLVGLALVALSWDGLLAGVIIIQAAMPAGLMVSMMAETYGADARFAAAATLWTTVAAVITLPLAAYLVLGLF